MLQAVTQKGGTVIDPNDQRLIEEGATEDSSEWFKYPRYYETQDGRKWWAELGEEPTITLAGRILWDREKIRETSARFRLHLRDARIVQAMHPLTLQQELAKARNRVERLASRVGMNPHLTDQLKRREARLIEMVDAFEEMQGKAEDEGIKLKPPQGRIGTPKPTRGEAPIAG